MENFGVQVAGAIVKGAASGGGFIGGIARGLQTGGNAISGIKKNVTKWRGPSKNQKSKFKKINPIVK